MEYRNLGRTGVKVSPLCLGTMMFARKADLETACRLTARAVDAGINFIDTADVYGQGAAEEHLGEALARSGARERVVLASKVYGGMADDDPNAQGVSRRHIIAGCEASLRRLRTDRIDLYQVHRPDHNVPIDETLRALDDLVRAGKVRYLGLSSFPTWRVVESIWIAKELGLNRVVCEQPPYNLLDRRIENELLPAASDYGLAIIPWSPLAGGFLTGKYGRDSRPSGARYTPDDGETNTWHERYFVEPAFRVVDRLRELATAHDATPGQIALAWLLHREGVTAPIIGPRTVEQLEDNLGALDVRLDADELASFDQLSPRGQAIVPLHKPDRHATACR
ncbi:MAG: aldo/keto reductase [Planctomycetota bacterium]